MSLADWIIGVVAAAIVSVLGALAWIDRARIAADAAAALKLAREAHTSVEVFHERVKSIDGRLGRIEETQVEVLRLLRNGGGR